MSGCFLLATFKQTDESLYLSISHDGRTFEPLFGGCPVLSSSIGNRSIRDPFIFRDKNKIFHLVATDGFSGVSIFHAVSSDLCVWRNLELISPFGRISRARNVWAPKTFTDLDGTIAITWSSTLSLLRSRSPNNHRIWVSKIGHSSIAAPKLWFDPKYNCIDFCSHVIGQTLYASFKDERGTQGTKPDVRSLRTVQYNMQTRKFEKISDVIAEGPAEGPCLFRCGDLWHLLYDKYLDGNWGGLSSADFINWHTMPISVPYGSRHGSILELTYEEQIRLTNASRLQFAC